MKKNVSMASFYCLVSKIWNKNRFYVAIKKEKNAWFVLFLKCEKLTAYLCRFVIKYS